MKATKENILCLNKMGFYPEDNTDLDGWWTLKGNGWSFVLSCRPNIASVVKQLVRTNYCYGYDDGADKHKPRYRLKL